MFLGVWDGESLEGCGGRDCSGAPIATHADISNLISMFKQFY